MAMKLLNHTIRFSCLLLACINIIGCGGSGSGGFDTPTMTGDSFKSEQSAITEVTREGSTGECVKTENTLICPTDAQLPSDEVSPVAGLPQVSEPASLSINPKSRSVVTCVRTLENNTAACKLTVRMSPKGFPRNTKFLIATHLKGSSIWRLGSAFKPIASDPDPPIFEAAALFEKLPSENRPPLQIVVLVYLPDKELPQSDILEPLLSRFHADAVFVVADLTIKVNSVGTISGDLISTRLLNL